MSARNGQTLCRFGIHTWKVEEEWHNQAGEPAKHITQFIPGMVPESRTMYGCTRCGKIKVEDIYDGETED